MQYRAVLVCPRCRGGRYSVAPELARYILEDALQALRGRPAKRARCAVCRHEFEAHCGLTFHRSTPWTPTFSTKSLAF